MKKRIWILAIAVLVVAAAGVGVFLSLNNTPQNLPVTLEAPEIRLNQDLSVQWEPVEGAENYLININGGDLRTTEAVSYPAIAAPGEYTVGVMALGGGGRSERSNTVSYRVYGVQLPESELYSVHGAAFVGQNQRYSFTVSYAEGCTDSTPTVKINGKAAAAENGVYSVENVTEDLLITVEGVELNRFQVTLPSGTGYTLSGSDYALYGKDYSFTVKLQEKYNRSNTVVKANGEVLQGTNGTYTVANVTEDMEITVSGVTLNRYNVRLGVGRGYTIDPAGNQAVSHGDSISFTVTPDDPAYGLTVKLNGKVLTAQNGEYTILDITSDMTVTVEVSGLPELTVADKLLEPESWKGVAYEANGKTLTVSPNATLKADYLKDLWEEGYTHLVFTARLGTDGAYIHGSSDIYRYWNVISANTDTDVRVDLNEFCVDGVWYDINFANMTGGTITVSNPRAYSSAETLQWTKSGVASTNLYFALEDGYYVLDTRAGGQTVKSPTQWLEKYCLNNASGTQSWFVYTDYLQANTNYRSVLWGFGEAINQIKDGTQGGWVIMNDMQSDGYQNGEVFSLHLETPGTARFRIADTVSNRAAYAGEYSYTYIDDHTYSFTTPFAEQKFHLATTQELINAGYTGLKVTLTGSLPDGVSLWYGDDNWGSGGSMVGISGESFVDGQCSFTVDFAMMGENEYFTIMTSGNSADKPITDMQVKIETLGEGKPPVYHAVTLPTGTGYTVSGKNTAVEGKAYSFTVTVAEGYDPATLLVAVNGEEVTGANGEYTAREVTGELVITVTGPELYTYQVTPPVGEGYTFAGNATVKHGESYVFTVTPDQAGTNIIVTVNGTAVSPVDGSYTVANVTEALVITAECWNGKYLVTIPTGSNYTVSPSGEQQVDAGAELSFTVVPNNPDATVTVLANGKEAAGADGVYTLTNVSENITVTITAHSVVEEILNTENWNTGGTVVGQTIETPANAILSANYLKKLWDEGYTHLVFTARLGTDGAYIHGSSAWDRYWNVISANTDTDVRIDLNEFCVDGVFRRFCLRIGASCIISVSSRESRPLPMWITVSFPMLTPPWAEHRRCKPA